MRSSERKHDESAVVPAVPAVAAAGQTVAAAGAYAAAVACCIVG